MWREKEYLIKFLIKCMTSSSYHALSSRSNTDPLYRSTKENLNEFYVFLAIVREILVAGRRRDGRLPARKSLVHHLHFRQHLQISYQPDLDPFPQRCPDTYQGNGKVFRPRWYT